MTKLDEALGLFPSVIKSGEQWSPICQSVLDEAKVELAILRARLAKANDPTRDDTSSDLDIDPIEGAKP